MANDVAVFLDLDNLVIAAKQANLPFDINLIVDYIKRSTGGRVVLRRAYGDWRQNQKVPEDLAAAGFELQSTVRLSNLSKNLADMQMVVDAMETLLDGHDFNTYVLLTGDRDFTPLVQSLRMRGKYVMGLGFRHTASRSLVRLCDTYIFYEELLPGNGVQEKAPQKPAQPVNQTPAEPVAEERLAAAYTRELKRNGLRVVPAPARLTVLKEMTDYLTTNVEAEWRAVIGDIYERHRQGELRLSKNTINSVLIAAKRAGVIHVGRGKTLSSAPVRLDLEGKKPFQEAMLRCDALYLGTIAAAELPFNLEQAAQALYDSPGYTRYLKIVNNRYNQNGSQAKAGVG